MSKKLKCQEKNKNKSCLSGKRKLDESDDDDDIFEWQSKCIRTVSKTVNSKTEKKSPASSKNQKVKRKPTKKGAVTVTKKRTEPNKEKLVPNIVNDVDRLEQKNQENRTNLVQNSPVIRPEKSSDCSSNSGLRCNVESEFRTPTKVTEKTLVNVRTPASHKKTTTPHKKLKLQTPSKSQSKKKSVTSGIFAKLTPLKTSKNQEYCPSCRMPFHSLVEQSPNWHMTECMEVSRTPLKECPSGLDCISDHPDHYKKYRHQIIANVRAGVDVIPFLDNANRDVIAVLDDATNRDLVLTVSDDFTSSGDTADPYQPLLRRFSNDRPSRKLDFGNNTDSVIDDNGTGIVDNETENVDNETENVDREWTTSPDDIFAVLGSDEENSIHSVPESCLSDIFGRSGRTSTVNFGSESVDSRPTGEVTSSTDVTSNLTICRISDVRTLSGSQVKNDEVDSTPPEIQVLGESRDQKMTSPKPTSSHKQQSTLHSFFHVPETYKAPIAAKERKQRPVKKKSSTSTPTSTSTSVENTEAEEPVLETQNKNCPFYKRIPGTKFTVDAFRYGTIQDCEAYFLSHFHYDHYGGLTKRFKQKIYCSKVTGNLVCRNIRVADSHINRLPMNQEVFVNGTSVTLLDANHCPGAAMFLFRLKDGRTMLHTGDFRASETMESYPQLIGARIHQLYLDTTYCNQNYAFPSQQDMISLAVDIATKAVRQNRRTLFVCGTYTIGKEKIFLAIADALNVKFCVTKNKKTILECLDDPSVEARMTLSWQQAQVHVLKMMQLKLHILVNHLKQYAEQFDQLIAFEPTGWTHSDKKTDLYKPKAQREFVKIYGIPYSEHSSYAEMKRFVQFVNPDRILPTVNNGTAEGRQKMVRIFEEWERERQEMNKAKT